MRFILFRFWQVVLPSGNAVAEVEPQFDEIKNCPGRGIIITGPAPAGSGFDFFSRFFCPKLGINEVICWIFIKRLNNFNLPAFTWIVVHYRHTLILHSISQGIKPSCEYPLEKIFAFSSSYHVLAIHIACSNIVAWRREKKRTFIKWFSASLKNFELCFLV